VINLDSWYKLKLAGLTYKPIFILMENFKEFDEIYTCEKAFLKERFRFKEQELDKIFSAPKINLDNEKILYEKERVEVISLKDERYPFILRNIAKPPLFLYIKGKIRFPEKSLSIVGTRKISAYGKIAVEKIVGELVESGIAIVSGLALGDNGVAHKITLEKNGFPIAIVGSGLDVIYPMANKTIWESVAKKGMIISEYPLGTKPKRHHFPLRNRIIAGLTKGVLVGESYKNGGSLITARLAIDEGRDIFAVPGFISYPSFEGCNELIKKSEAKLVTSAKDILVEYGWQLKKEETKCPLSKEELRVLKVLTVEKSLDEIIMETGYEARIALSILMNLEMKKIVNSVAGGKFIRKNI